MTVIIMTTITVVVVITRVTTRRSELVVYYLKDVLIYQTVFLNCRSGGLDGLQFMFRVRSSGPGAAYPAEKLSQVQTKSKQQAVLARIKPHARRDSKEGLLCTCSIYTVRRKIIRWVGAGCEGDPSNPKRHQRDPTSPE